jgi:hypothetical protein
MSPIRRVFCGAILILAGIAAFIEAHSHAPAFESVCRPGRPPPRTVETICREGQHSVDVLASGQLSQTPYDLLRIGAWGLVIFGALLVIVGLIRYWTIQRTQPESQDS